MRNLTLKRNKAFVGSLLKADVYIQDNVFGNITVNSVRCRKIGELKNGQEKTFAIDDNEAMLFVISGKPRNNYSYNYYDIPEGNTDISLSGKNKMNYASEAYFSFDGNPTEETPHRIVQDTMDEAKRKKIIVITFVVLFIAIAIVVFIAKSGFFAGADVVAKDFKHRDVTITLTNQFAEQTADDCYACYSSNHVGVLIYKDERFEGYDLERYTLELYDFLLDEYEDFNEENVTMKKRDGIPCVEYITGSEETGDEVHWFCFNYESSDAFWEVIFFINEYDYSEYIDSIVEWAGSVKFRK